MNKNLLYALLLLFIGGSAQARYYGEGADGYRPRCVETSSWWGNLFFTWDEKEKSERSLYVHQLQLPCQEWRSTLNLGWLDYGQELRPGQRRIFGVLLDDDTLDGLDQVRYGASVLRTEKSGEAFLARQPIRHFTFEINQWLTDLYGVGFAGDVYRAWIESKPRNRELRAQYLREIELVQSSPDPAAALRDRAGNLTVLVSLGMDWDPATAPPGSAVDIFAHESQMEGIETVLLKNHARDDSWSNIDILAEQLEQTLDSGRDVILMGLCKGSPELLAAMVEATSRYLDVDRTQKARGPHRGKILAYINISGLLGGTLFADAMKKIPFQKYAGPFLQDSRRLAHLFPYNLFLRDTPENRTFSQAETFGDALEQMEQMSQDEMLKFDRSTWLGRLPSDVLYLSGVGIADDKRGFNDAQGSFTAQFRNMGRKWHFTRAANDGFIEYPKEALPDGISSQEYEIVFNASHVLWEGYFGPYYLDSPRMREALFMAMYNVVLDHLGR